MIEMYIWAKLATCVDMVSLLLVAELGVKILQLYLSIL